jgi:hypothetical protein
MLGEYLYWTYIYFNLFVKLCTYIIFRIKEFVYCGFEIEFEEKCKKVFNIGEELGPTPPTQKKKTFE